MTRRQHSGPTSPRISLRPGAGVQAHRGRGGEVQALGPPVDRHPDPASAAATTSAGSPCASLPNSHSGRRRSACPGRRARPGRRAGPGGGQSAQTGGPRGVDEPVRRRRRSPRRGGTGCRRWPAPPCRCRGRRRRQKTTALGAGGVGACAGWCRRCPGRSPPPAPRPAAGGRPAPARARRRRPPADGDESLRGDRLRQRGRVLARRSADRRRRRAGPRAVRAPRAVANSLDDRAGGQRLAHGLGALGKKTPGLAAGLPSGETAGRREPGVRAAEQLSCRCRAPQAAGDWAPPVPSAATAARATSTSAAKAASSVTARSASTLRSTVTPARRRPWMNRL